MIRALAIALAVHSVLNAPSVGAAEEPAAANAKAATVSDSSMASAGALAPETTPLLKCGEAKLSVLFWDVYESALFTPDGRYRAGVRPLRLDIRYLRDIDADDLVTQTGKEWEGQGLTSEQHVAWLEQLRTLWPDVRKGDVISLNLDLNGRATFSHNGELLGRLDNPQFGEDFSGIWLSPETSRPALRSALIGGSSGATGGDN